MKTIKLCLVFSVFLLFTKNAPAQLLADYSVGPSFSFLSTSDFKSTMGIGLQFSQIRKTRVGYSFEMLNEYSLYYNTFGVGGYSVGDNNVYTNTNTLFCKYGANYMIGLSYFIVPETFSVNAGIAGSVNLIAPDFFSIGKNNLDSKLGDPPAVPGGPTNSVDELTGFFYDYGLHIGAYYRMDKVQFSLSYFKGFNNMASGVNSVQAYSATCNDIMLGIHFHIREFGIAHYYQNKLVK